MLTHRLAHECTACGKLLENVSSIDRPGAKPSAGDLTVCDQCATVLAFVTPNGDMRAADDEDFGGLHPTQREHIQAAVEFIKEMRGIR